MTELPIQQILLETVSVIEELGIPYAVMDGFAARAWGLPRPTFDADIAVRVDADGLQRLFDALEAKGFDITREHRSGFLDVLAGFEKAQVNRFLDSHVWHTDLFVARGAFLSSALNRTFKLVIGGRSLAVMSPEDIILLKLIANRRKDLADVEEIIGVCKDIDQRYLREWAEKMNVSDRLNSFLSPS